jgi:hypothetical protein
LPDLEHLDYSGSEAKFKFSDTIYLAEIRNELNGFLNADMISGASVAKLIAERLK